MRSIAMMASAEIEVKAVCALKCIVPLFRQAVFCPAHITSSVFINDDERGLHQAPVLYLGRRHKWTFGPGTTMIGWRTGVQITP